MALSARMQSKLNRKSAVVEKEIERLTRDLESAIKDQRNPLSRVYPSQKVGCDNLPAHLVRQLESAQDDLKILREVRNGSLDLRSWRMLKRDLPGCMADAEKLMAMVRNMQATLACIERARTLLR